MRGRPRLFSWRRWAAAMGLAIVAVVVLFAIGFALVIITVTN